MLDDVFVFYRYQQGIKLLEDAEMANDAEEEDQKHLLLKLLLNRAQCLIKIHWPKKACINLQRALELDEGNPKALYRLGKAKRMLGNLDDARRFLIKAQRAAPDDTSIGNELASLDRQITRDRNNEKALYQRMLGGEQDRPPPRRDNDNVGDNKVQDEFLEEVFEQLEGKIQGNGFYF